MKDLLLKLAEVTERIIPEEQLASLTEKQIWYLKALCENILTPNTSAFYYKGKEESLTIIKNILKIKPYLSKKEVFLNMKFGK